jgi:formylmethanofuran:tetrahydromethanopterin formyltransferase
MTATGVPADRVKHERAIINLTAAVKAQAEKIDDLTNILIERTEEGILDSFEKKMTDQLSAQSEKFEVMFRGIGNQIDRLSNSSNHITSSSSSREVLSVPMTVPESHVETSLSASVGIPSHSIIQANVSTDVELALALQTEIIAWKVMTPQSHLLCN